MKKMMVVALMLGAGVAFASSLGVPWFVDTAPAASKLPPINEGVSGIVYLHNNQASALTCTIEYFTQAGISIGPTSNNTFVIPAKATVAFRPVACDPDTVAGGQEGAVAAAIPDRPRDTVANPLNDGKKNGSIVVTWVGGGQDVQGVYMQSQAVTHPLSTADPTGQKQLKLTGYGHLLPPGT